MPVGQIRGREGKAVSYKYLQRLPDSSWRIYQTRCCLVPFSKHVKTGHGYSRNTVIF